MHSSLPECSGCNHGSCLGRVDLSNWSSASERADLCARSRILMVTMEKFEGDQFVLKDEEYCILRDCTGR